MLYAVPSARWGRGVNGELLEPFALYRGTRQGCPLLPLLFALALEPLAPCIHASPDVVEFLRCPQNDVISLYADDTLLYLGDTQGTMKAVMSHIENFRALSIFSINWNKSVLMLLDHLPYPLTECAKYVQIVFSFRYLGIQITFDPNQYIELNVLLLLRRFREKLPLWCKLPLSVVGRINLIKMVCTSQLLYVFNNSPIWIPRRQFICIDSQF